MRAQERNAMESDCPAGAHLVQRPYGCADELQLDALGGEV